MTVLGTSDDRRKSFQRWKLVGNVHIHACALNLFVMSSEFSGDAKKGFLTLIECIRNPPKYFASRLYDTMKPHALTFQGLGTRDSELIRLIVSRSECDLALIRDEYPKQYGRTLMKRCGRYFFGERKRTTGSNVANTILQQSVNILCLSTRVSQASLNLSPKRYLASKPEFYKTGQQKPSNV
uniref:Annexin n=1 Tax=Parascaris equorum TaxID=6256 RepID=A0A914S6C6_PAREQ